MKASLRAVLGIAIALVIAVPGAIVMVASRTVPFVAVVPSTPQGTRVGCLDYHHHFGQDLVLLSAGGGRLYKAINEGWQRLSTPPDWRWSQVKATPDGTIYLYGLFDHQIYRSTDGGETWPFIGEFPSFTGSDTIEYFFPSPMLDVLFMGVENYEHFTPGPQGVYRNTDGGVTWERTLEGNVWDMAFSSSFAHDGIAFASLREYKIALGIWKTEDWGKTWFPVNDGLLLGMDLTGYRIAVAPQFPQDQTVFTISGLGLYKSTNGGESWSMLLSPEDVQHLPHFVVLSPNYTYDQTLLIWGYETGLHLSKDGGYSWQTIISAGDEYVQVAGVRRPGSFGPSPAPLPPGPHRVYLPFVSSYMDDTGLELWLVSKKVLGDPCYLYCSYDYGATWEEVMLYSPSGCTCPSWAATPMRRDSDGRFFCGG